MKEVLINGAHRYLDGELSYDEFVQGLVMAIAEAPDGPGKMDDLHWLAVQLVRE